MRAFFWLIEMQKNWRRPFPGDGSERVHLVWGAPFLSLALLGLMATAPFLQPYHRLPIVSFYSEWLAIGLGAGACLALLSSRFWKMLSAPAITLPLLGLIGLIAVQSLTVAHIYPAQALLPALYLAWAILLAVLAGWLREQLGLDKVLLVLAWFILIGGLLQALAGFAQYLGIYGWLAELLNPRKITAINGNLGQQNHFATQITLAALALAYLFALRRLSWPFTISLLVLFAFVLALSGSRSVALYAIGAFVLSLLAHRKTGNGSHSRLALLTGLLLALFLLAQYSLPWLNEWLKETLAGLGFNTEHLEILTATERGAVSGIEQRLVEWHKAWLMFLSSPLLGVGIGHYGWHSFILHGLPEFAEASPKSQLYHHAHNLFLEVLAELGITGLLVLLFLLVTWIKQFLKNWVTHEGWFIASVLLVLFIHSNLEYPHWYSYFLGLMVVFLALGDRRMMPLTFTPQLGQIGAAVSLSLIFSILALTYGGFRKLTDTDALVIKYSPEQATRTLQAISMNPLLAPWAEAALATHGNPDKRRINEQLALITRVAQLYPDPIKVYRQIVYLALAGNRDDASSLLKHSATAYAPVFPHYICNFKKLPDKEILSLIAEGERILGESPTCPTQEQIQIQSLSGTDSS